MNDVENEEANRLTAIFNAFEAPNGCLSNQNYARKRQRIYFRARKVRMRKSKQKEKKTNYIYIWSRHAAIGWAFEDWHTKHNRARFIAVVVDAVAAAAAAVCRYFAVFGGHIGYYVFDSRSNIHNMCAELCGLNSTDSFILLLFIWKKNNKEKNDNSILTNCSIRNVFRLNKKLEFWKIWACAIGRRKRGAPKCSLNNWLTLFNWQLILHAIVLYIYGRSGGMKWTKEKKNKSFRCFENNIDKSLEKSVRPSNL